jgi:hypothetical protein
MPLLESPALAAQTAGGGDAVTIIGTYELSDGSGVGVSRVVITPPSGYTTVTGVATNNATFSVRQVRAGSVVSTFASVTLASGTNLVAETPISVPVTSQPSFQQDDVIDVLAHQNGSGLAFGAGLFVEVDIS